MVTSTGSRRWSRGALYSGVRRDSARHSLVDGEGALKRVGAYTAASRRFWMAGVLRKSRMSARGRYESAPGGWRYKDQERTFRLLVGRDRGAASSSAAGQERPRHRSEDGQASVIFQKRERGLSPVVSGERVYVGGMTGDVCHRRRVQGSVSSSSKRRPLSASQPAPGRLVIGSHDGKCSASARKRGH